MWVLIHLRKGKYIESCPHLICSLKISCQSPECGFDEWPRGIKTSSCCSDMNGKMLIIYWSRLLIIKIVAWKECLWNKLACDERYSLHMDIWNIWIKERQRFIFVHMDLCWGYPALNSTWTSWLFLRTWAHFHNFYFPRLCLGLYWPCMSFGIFDYSYTETWMQNQYLLIERLHTTI